MKTVIDLHGGEMLMPANKLLGRSQVGSDRPRNSQRGLGLMTICHKPGHTFVLGKKHFHVQVRVPSQQGNKFLRHNFGTVNIGTHGGVNHHVNISKTLNFRSRLNRVLRVKHTQSKTAIKTIFNLDKTRERKRIRRCIKKAIKRFIS